MTWNRRLDLYVDLRKSGGAPCLLEGLSSQALGEKVQLMQRDILPVRVYFRIPAGEGAASAGESLASGSQMLLAAKVDPDDVALLFSANAFTEVTDSGQTYYEAELDLTSAAIETAMADKDQLECTVDITVQNAGNTQRATFRFLATVNQPVYDGEGDPAPSAPAWPLPSAIMLKAPEGANYRVSGGNLQIWNSTQGKYQTVWLTGEDGETQWNFGTGEE